MTLKKITVASLFLILSLSLAGCNTTKGFGQDLKKVGSKIEQQAEETGADND